MDLDAELTYLLRAARDGCTQSFARLYEVTRPRMFAIVMRIVREQRDAEDVLQEVYVKVWTCCPQFDEGKGQFVAWLTRISQHCAIDSLRRRRTRPQRMQGGPVDDGDPYLGLVSPDLQPCERLQERRTEEAVRRSLHGRSKIQREVLLLAFYEGLSHGAIAAKVGRPLGTVKSWINRSFTEMRPALAEHRAVRWVAGAGSSTALMS